MPSASARQLATKICLVGEERVGKTSLIYRFVHNVYSPEYLRTIGALVTKKQVVLPPEDGAPVTINLMVWDIMGKRVFMDLLGEAYFTGVQGVVAVADLTRMETFEQLTKWLEGVRSVVGPVPRVLLANKVDLVDEREVPNETIEARAKEFGTTGYLTSAKTGENVEESFLELAKEIRRNQLALEASLS